MLSLPQNSMSLAHTAAGHSSTSHLKKKTHQGQNLSNPIYKWRKFNSIERQLDRSAGKEARELFEALDRKLSRAESEAAGGLLNQKPSVDATLSNSRSRIVLDSEGNLENLLNKRDDGPYIKQILQLRAENKDLKEKVQYYRKSRLA